jgi:hypothetical protein
MSEANVGDPAAGNDRARSRRGTYIAVLLTEIVVILGLWAFSAHFGH